MMDPLPIKRYFTRTSPGPALLSNQAVFEVFKSEGDPPLFILSVTRFKARLKTSLHPNGISISKSWWSDKWDYEDRSPSTPFAKLSLWKTEIRLSDQQHYTIGLKEKSIFWHRKEAAFTTEARFYCEGQLVMVLTNVQEKSIFQQIVNCPMKGTIATSIESEEVIAGLLLFFQTRLFARNK